MTNRITKFIQKLDEKTKKRLKEKLKALKKSPFNMPGVKKLTDWGPNVYRLRIGKIRIIYKINKGNIEVIDIDYRGNIY